MGKYRIELCKLDLQELLGRDSESFTVATSIVKNGHSVALKALIDTGANGFAFINTDLAILIAQHFGIRTIPLETECSVRGYNGKSETPITHAMLLNLIVDGRRQLDIPMLIVELGQHDIILGRKWLAEFRILTDCGKKRLIWPEEQTLEDEITSQIAKPLPKTILRREKIVNPQHQEDANRRDHLIEEQIRREKRYQPRTYPMDYRTALNKMERNLQTPEKQPREQKNRSIPKTLPKIDIALIGAAPFYRHVKKKDTEVFAASLDEIDRIIQDKTILLEDDEEEVLAKLPSQYHAWRDVFSKKASDTLPPDRSCNHKLELEENASPTTAVGHSPLYKQSAEELEAAKKYIVENLDKGFIVPSNAPFASPILMARMPSGKLRFCVDYRRLNAITKKDRYPLPLIDELMERLGRAKVFTKLDIRQGFHRIRMSPESEDLTTFRTRYGAYKYRVMPFGLTNGPATFQRFVNNTFIDFLDDFLTAFIDDLLIYSDNELEHEEHVKKVLTRLREAGLQASIGKCEFHVKRTKYLGYIVTTEGIEVDSDKTAVVQKWREPATVKGVQSFLGFCNFYRRFIKNYSRVAKPLNRLTKADVPFVWS